MLHGSLWRKLEACARVACKVAAEADRQRERRYPTKKPEKKVCMDACHAFHASCLSVAMSHYLEAGGARIEPKHTWVDVRLRRQFAKRRSASRHAVRIMSAGICREGMGIGRACVASCEQLGGLEECPRLADAVPEACKKMAALSKALCERPAALRSIQAVRT